MDPPRHPLTHCALCFLRDARHSLLRWTVSGIMRTSACCCGRGQTPSLGWLASRRSWLGSTTATRCRLGWACAGSTDGATSCPPGWRSFRPVRTMSARSTCRRPSSTRWLRTPCSSRAVCSAPRRCPTWRLSCRTRRARTPSSTGTSTTRSRATRPRRSSHCRAASQRHGLPLRRRRPSRSESPSSPEPRRARPPQQAPPVERAIAEAPVPQQPAPHARRPPSELRPLRRLRRERRARRSRRRRRRRASRSRRRRRHWRPPLPRW